METFKNNCEIHEPEMQVPNQALKNKFKKYTTQKMKTLK